MPYLDNTCPVITTLYPSDKMYVQSNANGYTAQAPLNVLLNFIQQYFASPEFQNIFATPGGSGFNVNLQNSSANQWLVINPPAGFLDGGITLPAAAGCADGQEILVNCTQQVTTFTVVGNGAVTVVGAPTSLPANGFFRLRFYLSSQIWYRVG